MVSQLEDLRNQNCWGLWWLWRWLIPLSKWVITPVFDMGFLERVNPLKKLGSSLTHNHEPWVVRHQADIMGLLPPGKSSMLLKNGFSMKKMNQRAWGSTTSWSSQKARSQLPVATVSRFPCSSSARAPGWWRGWNLAPEKCASGWSHVVAMEKMENPLKMELWI